MAAKKKLFDDILQKIEDDHENKKNLKKNSHILLVDGMNLFLRAFASSPQLNDDGDHIGGIVASLNSLGYAIKKFNPTRCVVIFDGKGGSKRRKKIYPDYKKGRSKVKNAGYNRSYDFGKETAEEDMNREIFRLSLYLKALPVTFVMINYIEADDVIAYLVKQLYNSEKNRHTIMSTDKDFLQLVGPNVKLWRPTKKKTYGPEEVLEEYGVPPHQFIMYRAMEGDASDNISGVPYVGDKRIREKFSELISRKKRATVDDVIDHASQRLDESATYERVADSREILERNWKLMQLYDVNISASKKREIREIVQKDRTQLDRLKFRSLFFEDKLWAGINDVQKWITERFLRLSNFSTRGDDE